MTPPASGAHPDPTGPDRVPDKADVVLTLDIDWAPDFVLRAVRERIEARHVQATWFVTHASPETEALRRTGFERGIHPNFGPGSTHGNEPDTVLRTAKALAPEATSMRTHGLHQSSRILDLAFLEHGIQRDVSLFLPDHPHLQPVSYPRGSTDYVRIPYYWEDDVEMARRERSWTLGPLLQPPGLKVFDFHPIHVHLNSDDFSAYEAAVRGPGPALPERTPEDIDPHIREGPGVGTLFDAVLDHLERQGGGLLVHEITDHWPTPGGRP